MVKSAAARARQLLPIPLVLLTVSGATEADVQRMQVDAELGPITDEPGALGPGAGLPSLSAEPDVLGSERGPLEFASVTLRWTGAVPGDVIGLYYFRNEHDTESTGPYGVYRVQKRSGRLVTRAVVNTRRRFEYKLIHPADKASKNRYTCKDTGELDCTDASDFKFVDRVHHGVVMAVTNVLEFKSFDAPHHLHLSLGDSPDEMRVTWTSKEPKKTPQVRVGTAPDQWDVGTFSGTTDTYTTGDLCGPPATKANNFFSPGIFNDVLLTGLKPSTRYYYQIRNGQVGSQWSNTREFYSPPLSESSEVEPVEGIVYGDLGARLPFTTTFLSRWADFGNYKPARKTIEFIKRKIANSEMPLHVVHIGDISYSRGFSLLWEYFMTQISTISSHVPYMVGIGNHEYDWEGQPFNPWGKFGHDSGGECGVPYLSRFHMPGEEHTRNLYYSFDWGPLHYVIFSTEHDFLEGSDQYKWIEKDLSTVDRDKTPFVIIGGHRPMYSSSNVHGIEEHLQAALEPLLQKYYVDLALWGHIHMYERTVPISHNGTRPSHGEHGTVHVVIGNAGHEFQVTWKNQTTDDEGLPAWMAFRSHMFGVSTIRATSRELNFTCFTSQEGGVLDTFTISADDQVFRR